MFIARVLRAACTPSPRRVVTRAFSEPFERKPHFYSRERERERARAEAAYEARVLISIAIFSSRRYIIIIYFREKKRGVRGKYTIV